MKLPDKFDKRTVLTREEVAEVLKLSIRTVDRWIEEGRIPIVPNTSKRAIRIPVDTFIKRFSATT